MRSGKPFPPGGTIRVPRKVTTIATLPQRPTLRTTGVACSTSALAMPKLEQCDAQEHHAEGNTLLKVLGHEPEMECTGGADQC